MDCDIRPGFRTANEGCTGTSVTRFQAACRQFAVSEALEDVTTPGAGVSRSQLARTNARLHGVHTVYLHRLHVHMATSFCSGVSEYTHHSIPEHTQHPAHHGLCNASVHAGVGV